MTAYHIGPSGSTYYAKPLPLSSSPSWASDAVTLTESGSSGVFSFANDSTKAYVIYLRAGGSPASSDTITDTLAATDSVAIAAILEDTGTTLPAAIAAIEGGGGGLNGDYTLTVTVTDAADDEPIEGATVTLFRSGERGAEETDADGEAVFGLGAYTWTWIVTAAGYTSKTGTKTISANDTLAVELDAIVITPPTAAGTTTLSVLCLDEVGEPEQDVEIQLKMVGVPTGSTGNAFDGKTQTGTSGADGIVELTAIKSARYQYRRGNGSWIAVTLGTGDTQQVVSTIGVDE